jgi:hypothetical protein
MKCKRREGNIIKRFKVLFEGSRKYSIASSLFLTVYVLYLNTVVTTQTLHSAEGKYEYGLGIFFVIPTYWFYSFFCTLIIVLFVLDTIFRKPILTLIGTLLLFVFTVVEHALASYFTPHTDHIIWPYLISAYGVLSYIVCLNINKKKNKQKTYYH